MKAAIRRGAACLWAACALAGADQLEYTVYHFGDNSENSVFTSSFSLAKTLFARTMVQLDVELDQVTLPAQPDAVSGASRPQRLNNQEFKKNRGQVILGLEQGLGDNTKVAANYYFSQETDYRSQSAVASLTQELFQKNFTVSMRGQYTLDSVGEILPSGALLNRLKETWQASGSISQLLSPTTVARLGGDFMMHAGFLSDSYRKVDIPDPADPSARISVQESHPSNRYRQAGWGELSRFFRDLDAALHLHYRYGWDDWNLKSHTLQIKASKYVTPDWILTPQYRYYTQTAADFGVYPGDFHTGDYKLQAFDANTLGMGLTCLLRTFSRRYPGWDFLGNSSVSLLYFRYFTTTDFESNVVELRLKFAL